MKYSFLLTTSLHTDAPDDTPKTPCQSYLIIKGGKPGGKEQLVPICTALVGHRVLGVDLIQNTNFKTVK